jgi:energy-coupling factor transport system ATP-binding protein
MLQRLHLTWPARLNAIETAEAALLADIAVIFQLLNIYLPIGGGYFALLVPIPFAVLVLRRRLYVGIMGFCVALFIIGVLTGPGNMIIMGLEAGAGVFLGVTMKYRLGNFLLILLGVTSSALLLFSLLLLFDLLVGISFARLILSLQKGYLSLLIALGFISSHVGLGGWWQHNVYPVLASFAQLVPTYWWVFFFASIWIFLWPVVIVVHYITNFFVRLLGYDVRPFPGGIIDKLLRWILQVIIRIAIRLGLGKYRLTRNLIREVRLQGMRKRKAAESPGSVFQRGFLPEVPESWDQPEPVRSDRINGNAAGGVGYSQANASWLPAWETNNPRETVWQPHFTAQPADGHIVAPLAGARDALSARNVLIDIQQATYIYPGQRAGKTALQDVSLQIVQGEYVVLLGHNGSGKSTLARHCNALLTPTSGRVLIERMDSSDEANQRAIRDMVGMIFQNPDNQIIATVVEDDVSWALAVRSLPASLIRERVAYAMEAVGLSGMGKLPPQQLSGGQRQRLAIAGVLALRPRCIIADEATAQLDPLSRQEIVALLHQLQREHGLTIIQVTHLLEEAALAERIVVMEQGQIVLEGTPANVFADLERLRQLKLAIPEPMELAARLRAAGLPLSQEALTVEAIAQEIVR